MADPKLDPLVQATNEVDRLLIRGKQRDLESALVVSCGFLSELTRGETSIDGGRLKIPSKIDYAEWVWRKIADPGSAAHSGGLLTLFDDPHEADRFFDLEERLLVEAGLDEALASWYVSLIRDRSHRMWDDRLSETKLRRAFDQLREVVCAQASSSRALMMLAENTTLPGGYSTRRGLVFGMASAVLSVANATLLTFGGLTQTWSIGAGGSGFMMAAADLYDARFRP